MLNVLIVDESHNIEIDNLHIAGKDKYVEIIIKDGAWIGAGSIILVRVIIGKKHVVKAGNVVVNSISYSSIAVGILRKVIKVWNKNLLEWEIV